MLMELKNMSSYLIVNVIILSLFFIAYFYVFFSKKQIPCYIKNKYNIECKTCGLTRDFKSILSFNSKKMINPLSKVYFKSFSIFFISRVLIVVMLSISKNTKKIIIFDIVVVALILVGLSRI